MLGQDGSGDPPVSELYFFAFRPYGDRGLVSLSEK